MRFDSVLSLDPSSTATGYAVLRADGSLVEAGLLRLPGRRAALERVDAMCVDVAALCASLHVASSGRASAGCERLAVGVVEVPSGKVHRGRHGGGGAGLSVYGLAAGALRQELRACLGAERVVSVTAEQWTGGRRKETRNVLLAAELPAYGAVKGDDGGGDVGDAIALGRWWIRNRNAGKFEVCGG